VNRTYFDVLHEGDRMIKSS